MLFLGCVDFAGFTLSVYASYEIIESKKRSFKVALLHTNLISVRRTQKYNKNEVLGLLKL
jgi:hypothetical protein